MLQSIMTGSNGEVVPRAPTEDETKRAEMFRPPPPEPKKEEVPPAPEAPPVPEPPAPTTPEPLTASDNIKRLRQAKDEETRRAKEFEDKLTEAHKKLKDFETGVVAPELIQKYEDENARLSVFEKIHNLKKSKAYDEAVIKPLKKNKDSIKALIKDYGIDEPDGQEKFISDALSITNRAELNRFLAGNFDELGATEVRTLLDQTRGVYGKAKEMETEPEKALKELEKEHEKISFIRESERKTKIAENSRASFAKAISKVQAEGKAQELIYKAGDTKRNEIVKSHLTHAATEYGKVVTQLAEAGLSELPDNLAEYLADTILHSTAAAFAIETREQVLKHANELEAAQSRDTVYLRPQLGSGGNGASYEPPKGPMDAKTAAREILQKVMGS